MEESEVSAAANNVKNFCGNLVSWQLQNFSVTALQNYITILWANYFLIFSPGGGYVKQGHELVVGGDVKQRS